MKRLIDSKLVKKFKSFITNNTYDGTYREETRAVFTMTQAWPCQGSGSSTSLVLNDGWEVTFYLYRNSPSGKWKIGKITMPSGSVVLQGPPGKLGKQNTNEFQELFSVSSPAFADFASQNGWYSQETSSLGVGVTSPKSTPLVTIKPVIKYLGSFRLVIEASIITDQIIYNPAGDYYIA